MRAVGREAPRPDSGSLSHGVGSTWMRGARTSSSTAHCSRRQQVLGSQPTRAYAHWIFCTPRSPNLRASASVRSNCRPGPCGPRSTTWVNTLVPLYVMKIRVPHGSVGCATPIVVARSPATGRVTAEGLGSARSRESGVDPTAAASAPDGLANLLGHGDRDRSGEQRDEASPSSRCASLGPRRRRRAKGGGHCCGPHRHPAFHRLGSRRAPGGRAGTSTRRGSSSSPLRLRRGSSASGSSEWSAVGPLSPGGSDRGPGGDGDLGLRGSRLRSGTPRDETRSRLASGRPRARSAQPAATRSSQGSRLRRRGPRCRGAPGAARGQSPSAWVRARRRATPVLLLVPRAADREAPLASPQVRRQRQVEPRHVVARGQAAAVVRASSPGDPLEGRHERPAGQHHAGDLRRVESRVGKRCREPGEEEHLEQKP